MSIRRLSGIWLFTLLFCLSLVSAWGQGLSISGTMGGMFPPAYERIWPGLSPTFEMPWRSTRFYESQFSDYSVSGMSLRDLIDGALKESENLGSLVESLREQSERSKVAIADLEQSLKNSQEGLERLRQGLNQVSERLQANNEDLAHAYGLLDFAQAKADILANALAVYKARLTLSAPVHIGSSAVCFGGGAVAAYGFSRGDSTLGYIGAGAALASLGFYLLGHYAFAWF